MIVSMTTLRERINAQLFDRWHLGAPKTKKFVFLVDFLRQLTQETLTTREQRVLDWHYFRMKTWGVVIPAVFLTSFKPVAYLTENS